jgi:hypothetical protein
VLSQRERIIGFATAGVLGFLALDRVALTPLLERRAAASAAESTATVQLARAEQLIDNTPRMNDRWNGMIDAGLKSELTDSESQALGSILEWAQDSGVTLLSLQPDRVERSGVQKDKTFRQVTIRASGTGSMRSVSRFLYRVQAASIPLRVTDLQVNARKDGTDDLLVNLAVSTLVLAPPEPAKKPAGSGAGAASAGAAPAGGR